MKIRVIMNLKNMMKSSKKPLNLQALTALAMFDLYKTWTEQGIRPEHTKFDQLYSEMNTFDCAFFRLCFLPFNCFRVHVCHVPLLSSALVSL